MRSASSGAPPEHGWRRAKPLSDGRITFQPRCTSMFSSQTRASEWRADSSDETIRRTIERELRSGDECYAYWDGQRIAAASWVGFRNSPYLKKFAKAFGLAEDEALRRTTFVVPEYRGRRLQVLLAAEVENHVSHSRGINRFIVYVGIRNTASLRNLLKVYEESRPVYHVRLTLLGKDIDWFPNKDQLPWVKMQEKGNDSQV